MFDNEKPIIETTESPAPDFIPGDPQGFVPTADLSRELLAIRNEAIAEGMKVLSVPEVLAEVAADRVR
ncbi:MAG: hypothetical protein LBK52_04630 [Deltaproteobacteria bacterium]|jgi:hypothetical protein|nr:hypothetical protein [Deltaproteobacteria bacterium]